MLKKVSLLLVLASCMMNTMSAGCCGNTSDEEINYLLDDSCCAADNSVRSAMFMQALQDPKMRAFFEGLSPEDKKTCIEFCQLCGAIIQQTQDDMTELLKKPAFQALLEKFKAFTDISKLELRIELGSEKE